jgi:hypothetical protein
LSERAESKTRQKKEEIEDEEGRSVRFVAIDEFVWNAGMQVRNLPAILEEACADRGERGGTAF